MGQQQASSNCFNARKAMKQQLSRRPAHKAWQLSLDIIMSCFGTTGSLIQCMQNPAMGLLGASPSSLRCDPTARLQWNDLTLK